MAIQPALTVKQLCDLYRNDLEAGLILGKGGGPKKASTIYTDLGRIKRHIIPLLGNRRVKDLTRANATKLLRDVMAGNTRVSVKTEKLRGKSIDGGETRKLVPGDVVIIPNNVPHWFKEVSSPFNYYVVKVH